MAMRCLRPTVIRSIEQEPLCKEEPDCLSASYWIKRTSPLQEERIESTMGSMSIQTKVSITSLQSEQAEEQQLSRSLSTSSSILAMTQLQLAPLSSESSCGSSISNLDFTTLESEHADTKAMSNSSMVMASLASEESELLGASSDSPVATKKVSLFRMLSSEESEALLPAPRARPNLLRRPKRPPYQTRHTPPCYLVDYGIDVQFE
jgi:hypothetical protein